jgi:hypothetical protein
MEDIQAVCHGMTMFYPGGAERFLEAALSISEKVSGLARKVVGGFNARCSEGRRPVMRRRLRLACCQILIKREIS